MADITIHDVQSRLVEDAEAHTIQILDVREDFEVAQGTLEGAQHISLGEIRARMGELDRSRPIIAICRSGNRSGKAADILNAAGFAVDNMQGGLIEWGEAGLPLSL